MSPEREQKIRDVIRRSQPDLTVVLENVFDPLNVSAVLRSCDAVGVREVFLIYSEDYLRGKELKLGKKTSGGAFRWIETYCFTDATECFRRVRERYARILTTGLGGQNASLYDLDLSESVALVFGNEHEGLSPVAMAASDGNFVIPQAGFTGSLNVSAACAVTLFEASRQRRAKGFYDERSKFTPAQQELLFQKWKKMLLRDKNPIHAIPVSKKSEPLLPVFLSKKK
ncbi:MAG: TrmH family RNA methyltransferase [Saprospiraceae bacterium]